MKSRRIGLARVMLASAGLSLAINCSAQADTVYTYTGNPFEFFNDADPPTDTFTPAMAITGSFTLAAPLPNLMMANITAEVLNFSFSDGRSKITDIDASAKSFQVTTNVDGFPQIWSIALQGPAFTAAGQQQAIIDTHTFGFPLDQAFLVQCITFPACTNGIASPSGGSTFDRGFNIIQPGTWSVATVPGPLAGAGLPGLIFASGGLFGWWRRRQKIA
jgi:hypothetical protein